mmetsp:Transcript_150319/g.463842  ORF Transcript_150319/g.463842 Transcript_150319/m.463842 type:complete len:291 (+) Transcript_150319:37-909(+)
MAGGTLGLLCRLKFARGRAPKAAALCGVACAWLRMGGAGPLFGLRPHSPPGSSSARLRACVAAAGPPPRPVAVFPEGQDLDELFDVCEPPPSSPAAEGQGHVFPPGTTPALTGRVKQRKLVHCDGDWHRSVHVWVLDARGELLLQKRSEHKDTHPGLWDVSCAGHITAGDAGPATAVRELQEELGLAVTPSALEPVFTIAASASGATERHGPFRCNEYQEVFLLRLPGDHASQGYAPAAGEVAGLHSEPAAATERALRTGEKAYVPRCAAYVRALAAALARGPRGEGPPP